MKKLKVSILALSVLVGGAVFASAADVGKTGSIDIKFGEQAFGSNTPYVYALDGIFASALGSDAERVSLLSVSTDGAGKVGGIARFEASIDDLPITDANKLDLMLEISGKLGTKSSAATAQEKAKVSGWAVKNGVYGSAKGSVTFNGTIADIPQEVVTGYTNHFGTDTNLWTTNQVSKTNAAHKAFKGTLTGSINTGIKGEKPIKMDKNTTFLISEAGSYWVKDANGNVVQQSVLGLTKESIDLRTEIWALGKTLAFAGSTPYVFAGSGTYDSKKLQVKGNLKGVGSGSGSQLNLTGDVVPALVATYSTTYTNLTGTNWLASVTTNYYVVGVAQATVKGKIQGQSFDAQSVKNTGPEYPPAHVP